MGTVLSVFQPNSSQQTLKIQIKKENKKLKLVSQLVDVLKPEIDSLEKQKLAGVLSERLLKIDYMRSTAHLGPLTYQQILDYVNNTQEANHNFGIEISKIFYICPKEEADFAKFCVRNAEAKGRPRMMLWHGTTLEKVCSIIQHGFLLPKYESTKSKGLQGPGLYFADRVSKSAQYCDDNRKPEVGTTACLLLCDVLLGNTFYSKKPNNERSRPPNHYHSVACEGKLVPDVDGIEIVETDAAQGNLILPYGKSVVNTKFNSYNLKYNEFVVYNPEQVKVRYLVFFTFTQNKHVNVLIKGK